MTSDEYMKKVMHDVCKYQYDQLPDALRDSIIEIAISTKSPEDVLDELLLPPRTTRRMDICQWITIVAATAQIADFLWRLWDKSKNKEIITIELVINHDAAKALGNDFEKTFDSAKNNLPDNKTD